MFEFLSGLVNNIGSGLSQFGSSVGEDTVLNYGNSIGDFFSGNAGNLAPYPSFDANEIVWKGANDSSNPIMASFLNNVGKSLNNGSQHRSSSGSSFSGNPSLSPQEDLPLIPIGDNNGDISIGGKVSVGKNKEILSSLVKNILNSDAPLSSYGDRGNRNLPPDTTKIASPIDVVRGSNGELVVLLNGKKITGSGDSLRSVK